MTKKNEKNLVRVAFNETKNTYHVYCAPESSVNETAFALSVVARVFERDGLMPVKEFCELVTRYATDEQFKEVEDVKNG